jgi:hypothetical protein
MFDENKLAVDASVPAAKPGDIVIISAEGLHDVARSDLLKALASVGFNGLVAGVEPPGHSERNEDRAARFSKEVNEWRSKYSDGVDQDYLEQVVRADDVATSTLLLTEVTIRRIFGELYGANTSTSISSGQIYRRTVNAIERLHKFRDYISEGTLFLGQWKKTSGHAWEQRHWGITPEALYGLTLEDERITGLGKTAKTRIQHLLSHITGNQHPVTPLRQSGWLGHERSISVG